MVTLLQLLVLLFSLVEGFSLIRVVLVLELPFSNMSCVTILYGVRVLYH